MTRVYRILREHYATNSFDGEGAFLFGGRWSSPGTRIAYAAEHLSLAMVEYFVHLNADDPPKDLVVVGADIPDSVSRIVIAQHDLPADWRQVPAGPTLADIGDSFVAERQAAVLVVPSALVPSESNWLINPVHPQFADIQVLPPEPFQYDARFFG
ncbi:RES family NAD+ phosphorylase [Paludibaculum fermentans]|uniref:RES family NAD+ phosphorylase n=1 Tax=Paludibaculum fermentans TaxID=1473598 RepID=A0A7S7SL70_PALFE|nr:RES family NAD+ phosphorylase [Paludibaculum fermentans]QOY87775.1 RES family NAD+ phosphorylase [Paludibaculum fermentans]